MAVMHCWSGFIGNLLGLAASVLLGVVGVLIPGGLHLPKSSRHPFKRRPVSINPCGKGTKSWQEWWGSNLQIVAWFLLIVSFFIQAIVTWP